MLRLNLKYLAFITTAEEAYLLIRWRYALILFHFFVIFIKLMFPRRVKFLFNFRSDKRFRLYLPQGRHHYLGRGSIDHLALWFDHYTLLKLGSERSKEGSQHVIFLFDLSLKGLDIALSEGISLLY